MKEYCFPGELPLSELVNISPVLQAPPVGILANIEKQSSTHNGVESLSLLSNNYGFLFLPH